MLQCLNILKCDSVVLSGDQEEADTKVVLHAMNVFSLTTGNEKGVMIDLSIIPPCQLTRLLHMETANYVARLWKLTGCSLLIPPSPVGYGWDQDGDIQWIEEMLPADL